MSAWLMVLHGMGHRVSDYCRLQGLPSSQASFGLPETGLGILPGAGGASELQALIGAAHTLRLGMTGERIDASEALRIGLVQETVADFSLGFERAASLCNMVSKKSPSALAAFKRGVLESLGEPAHVRVEHEARAYEHCVESGEAAIGRASFQTIPRRRYSAVESPPARLIRLAQ